MALLRSWQLIYALTLTVGPSLAKQPKEPKFEVWPIFVSSNKWRSFLMSILLLPCGDVWVVLEGQFWAGHMLWYLGQLPRLLPSITDAAYWCCYLSDTGRRNWRPEFKSWSAPWRDSLKAVRSDTSSQQSLLMIWSGPTGKSKTKQQTNNLSWDPEIFSCVSWEVNIGSAIQLTRNQGSKGRIHHFRWDGLRKMKSVVVSSWCFL